MAYNGRRGPNVTQFIRDIDSLNEIPSEQDIQGMEFDMDADLAMFTNTFFDFDQNALPAAGFAVNGAAHDDAAAADGVDMGNVEFSQGDFNFPDFTYAQPRSFARDSRSGRSLAPIQTQSLYPGSPLPTPTGLSTPSTATSKPKSGNLSASSPVGGDFGESSRQAAEEDKRRRNTAASARFRVKKKQREQALERSAKDMADKVANFEKRIAHLEMENKWLKNLITERNTEGGEDIGMMYNKYIESHESKGSERKDGVGTKLKA